MPSGHPNDLVQRGRVFYFRRAVPRGLRGQIGRRELKLSLKTTELRTAKLRCRQFSNRFEQLMETVMATQIQHQIGLLAMVLMLIQTTHFFG